MGWGPMPLLQGPEQRLRETGVQNKATQLLQPAQMFSVGHLESRDSRKKSPPNPATNSDATMPTHSASAR